MAAARFYHDLSSPHAAAGGPGLRDAVRDDAVKRELRAVTDDAMARGVTGIPTVEVGDERYWGDDRLEEAAAA